MIVSSLPYMAAGRKMRYRRAFPCDSNNFSPNPFVSAEYKKRLSNSIIYRRRNERERERESEGERENEMTWREREKER
jgi:hypothetical protein